jgi:hypothetical protein
LSREKEAAGVCDGRWELWVLNVEFSLSALAKADLPGDEKVRAVGVASKITDLIGARRFANVVILGI